MILTINLYNFRYQIYKACEERSVYLELVIEFPQRKTYKLLDGERGDSQQPHHHFHYENRLSETESSLSRGRREGFETLFFWSFIRLKQPDGRLRASLGFSLGIIQKSKSPVKKQ